MKRLIEWLDRKPGRVAEAGLATLIIFVIAILGIAAAGTQLDGLQNRAGLANALYTALGNAVAWVHSTAQAIASHFR
jgi:hypothetical protein